MATSYADAAHKHAAVTSVSGGHSYAYDANGNPVSRTFRRADAELCLLTLAVRPVSVSGERRLVYDGDGRRVKGTVMSLPTTWAIGHEVSAGVVKNTTEALAPAHRPARQRDASTGC